MVDHILCVFLFHPLMVLVSSLKFRSFFSGFRLWSLETGTLCHDCGAKGPDLNPSAYTWIPGSSRGDFLSGTPASIIYRRSAHDSLRIAKVSMLIQTGRLKLVV
ncbi:hypothetical protein BJY00DRAFT_40377 [Aspergillus carlsbadensis]|nr:hypothetical protein BJY00DRAFT_40377 [Aspergillus carlsbadensis]